MLLTQVSKITYMPYTNLKRSSTSSLSSWIIIHAYTKSETETKPQKENEKKPEKKCHF